MERNTNDNYRCNSNQTPEQSQANQNQTSNPNDQTDNQATVNQRGLHWTEIGLFAALGVIAALLAVIAVCTKN